VRLIIDSHLDLAWNAVSWKRDLTLTLDELNRRDGRLADCAARGRATTTLPELRLAGVAVCLGTVLARTPHGKSMIYADMLDYPTQEIAFASGQGQLAYYRVLESQGQVRMLRTAADLDTHWQQWQSANEKTITELPVGLILAMEGSDPIVDPAQAQWWFDDGLRCASLVHYGRSAYAGGTGDNPDAPGLTEQGRQMLKQFERLGIILDLTHLSDTSFFEAMDQFTGPVLASHQNCRTLVPGGRQFSDEQIKMVIERDGVLGVAFDSWMLYPGWQRGPTIGDYTPRHVVSIDTVADHIDHICQLVGNRNHIAIGTDLDGGFGSEQTPSGLDSIADLQKLNNILSGRGFSNSDLDGFFHGNWLRYFHKYLP